MLKRLSKGAVGLAFGLSLGAGALALLAAPRASAERVDPAFPTTMTVGPPAGACPLARVDEARTGRTEELPATPREIWHRRVRGGMTLPVVVDENGSIIVAAAVAELVQVGPDGAEQWHRRLGMSVASAGPVVLSNGTRFAITALGHAWGYGPDGTLRIDKDLGAYGTDPRALPLARSNGSVVVALGSNVLTLDSEGELVDRVDVGERVVGALIASAGGVLITTESGKVFTWQAPLPPRSVGTFRGLVRDGAALQGGKLLAIADMDRLVAMDLASGATSSWTNMFGLEGPPTIASGTEVIVGSTTGLLLTVSSEGEERRIRLAPAQPATPDEDGGVTAPVYAPASPAVLVDRAGRVAFARSDGRVGIVSAQGDVHFAAKRSCGTPICIVPAGKARFVVACRTGDLRLYGP